jgi:hypothetical protein
MIEMTTIPAIRPSANEETRRPASPISGGCEAPGCKKIIEPNYLFCGRHRGDLPPALLANLRALARPGMRRSARWVEAAAEAVEYLARREGRPINNRFRDELAARPAV